MLSWLRILFTQRKNIMKLVWSDFSQCYLSSYLGFVWAIISPLIMMFVLTLVFQVGFRVQPAHGSIPFTAWLLCGMVPWLYFAESLTSSAQSVTSYAFLVRKSVFRISYLPVIRLCSSAIIHAALLGFMLIVLLYFNFYPSLYWIQFFYYFLCMYTFLLGMAWLTSSLSVFVPDIVNLLSVCTNLGFWVTPIFWDKNLLPPQWQWIFTINPAYYIVQGYRDTFIENRWLWERPFTEHFAFVLWLVIALFLGSIVFKHLRPHFADVI